MAVTSTVNDSIPTDQKPTTPAPRPRRTGRREVTSAASSAQRCSEGSGCGRARHASFRRRPRARHHGFGAAGVRRFVARAGGAVGAVDQPATALGVRPRDVHGRVGRRGAGPRPDRQRARMDLAPGRDDARGLDDGGSRRELHSRTRRWIVYPVCLTLALCASAACTRPAREATDDLPMAGRLVDVGGHKLHIDCRGTGSPTVVLEPGLGEPSTDMAWISKDVGVTTRVLRVRPSRSRLERIRRRTTGRRRSGGRAPHPAHTRG